MNQIDLLPLDSSAATLERAGGKGANLARLARAGFPVPPGFLVTTAAYRSFVAANHLTASILGALDGIDMSDAAALDTASQAILSAFQAGAVPPALEEAIRAAYAGLREPPVAVRSSATAEDLPDLSFAGQQDTYLNVRGGDSLVRAVVDCWASLWTARAIGYRARNEIDQAQVSLAVIVQEMVQSEASGVLFTANPLTGLRAETVIDATVGLGEALVSGLVEPDHYVVETASGRVLSRTLGAKALSIRSLDGGGVERVAEKAAARQALPDDIIAALVELGARVAAEYEGAPQDIEWAWAAGRIFLLQSRPITSLFPLPADLPPDELAVMFSFGAVQGMQDPMTPLGQDAFRYASAAFGRLWKYDFAPGKVPALKFAGERMWLRFTPLLRNDLSRRLWRSVLVIIEAGAGHALESFLDDEPRLVSLRRVPTPEVQRRIVRVVGPILFNLLRTLANPDQQRIHMDAVIEQQLAALAVRADALRSLPPERRLAARVELARTSSGAFVQFVATLLPCVAAGMASFYRTLALTDKAGIPRSQALEISRGLPHNPTTQMDLLLWETAVAIRNDPASLATVRDGQATELAKAYLARKLPPVAQAAMQEFLDRYGMRGAAEIDMGRPRWREQPVQVFQMVQNYLHIEDETLAPNVLFRKVAESAEAAIPKLAASVREASGPAAAHLVEFLAQRVRALAGLREAPKFFVIRIMGIVRKMLLESFEDLAAQGVLEDPQDGFFLRYDELSALAAGYAIDWKALVRERRAIYAREMRRKQVPRLLLSDGRAFYGGADGDGSEHSDLLRGSPVSPGTVEGSVRIVFDPHHAQLFPGEVLVCPGTDPAWTPLFLSACALVMEVGGMMTHGSVVAREYGIPAVVGVARVTERLQTGDRIRVDGSSGSVTVLERAGSASVSPSTSAL